MSMRVIRSRLKAFFARCPYGDISMRRSSSSSAEEVGTEDNFSQEVEVAIAFSVEAVFVLEAVFSLEVPTGVCVLKVGAELIAFLGVEGVCGSIVEVSATVCES